MLPSVTKVGPAPVPAVHEIAVTTLVFLAVFAVIALACPDEIPVLAVLAVIALACAELIPVLAVLAVIADVCAELIPVYVSTIR